MNPVLLESTDRGGPEEPRQRPLFEDFRRARPEAETAPEPHEPELIDSGPTALRGEGRPRSGGDRLTLEAHLERIWEGLLVAGAADCVVCGGTMERTHGRGVCGACGSALS